MDEAISEYAIVEGSPYILDLFGFPIPTRNFFFFVFFSRFSICSRHLPVWFVDSTRFISSPRGGE